MATRRRGAGAGGATGATAPSPYPMTGRMPRIESDDAIEARHTKWFHIYYGVLCTVAIATIGIWFLFFRMPYASHASYDPLGFLPIATRNQVVRWYQNHPAPANKKAARNDLPDLMTFLARYEKQGHFDSPHVRNYEHYVESMVNGWLSGVFETLVLDSRDVDEIEKEEKGVGSIPGGSRRLNQKIDRALSPIVKLLYEDSRPVEGGEGGGVNKNVSHWASLQADHQNWVYEGLSHCHTTPCRLAKMQLMTLWRDKMTLFPEHEHKDAWTLLTQLFHPDTHPYRLIDAPANLDTLCSLWFRFFSTGDITYVHRLLELTRLTGSSAYQTEKDREIREWSAKKHARAEAERLERWEAAKALAIKEGTPAPVEPPALKAPKLPKSPTHELYTHYFNSLLFYADEHPLVKQAFKQAWMLDPKNQVNQLLADTTPFKIKA